MTQDELASLLLEEQFGPDMSMQLEIDGHADQLGAVNIGARLGKWPFVG